MGTETKIQWCDSTWNPWIGCTKISPGCDNCYASTNRAVRALGVMWGAGQPRRRTSAANWRLPRRWDRIDGTKLRAWDAFKSQYHNLTDDELTAKGFIKPHRRRVFCGSLCDVFDNEVSEHWRIDLFRLIHDTPNLDWLLLTKRIGNARGTYNAAMGPAWCDERPWPPNVWLGTTICNQEDADRDIPKLLEVPARVRFLSIEPLLGSIEIGFAMPWRTTANGLLGRSLDWVIVGGESGKHARPMHPDWVRSIRDQCAAYGVPFFFKQWGEWAEETPRAGGDLGGDLRRGIVQHLHATGNPEGFFRSGDAYVRRVGKIAAGNLLDGITHAQWPE